MTQKDQIQIHRRHTDDPYLSTTTPSFLAAKAPRGLPLTHRKDAALPTPGVGEGILEVSSQEL